MAQYDIGQIAINCGVCGSAEMAFDEAFEDDSEVHCAKCGARMGTVGALRSAAFTTARSKMPEIAEALKKAFKF